MQQLQIMLASNAETDASEIQNVLNNLGYKTQVLVPSGGKYQPPCNDKFSIIFQANPMPTFISSLETGQILDANKAALDLFGYTLEEMLTFTSLGLGFWGDPAARAKMLEELCIDGHAHNYSISFKSLSNETRQFLAAFDQIALDGKTAILTILHDVTELEQNRRAESLLAAIVESSQDAVISKSLDGQILSWNTGASNLYGYTAEDAIGQPVSMLISPDRPDELPHLMEKIRRGENVTHYETGRRRKDGSIVEVSISISPVKDNAGNIIGASSIARDISERKQLERSLAEANQLNSVILESISDGFYSLDANERFTFVNSKIEELWGKRREELLGKIIWDVFPQMVGLYPYQCMNRALTEQILVEFETFSGLLKQWLMVSVYPVNGGISVYFRDITERKLAEEALRQSEERFQAFMDNTPALTWIMDVNGRILFANNTSE